METWKRLIRDWLEPIISATLFKQRHNVFVEGECIDCSIKNQGEMRTALRNKTIRLLEFFHLTGDISKSTLESKQEN